MSKLKRLKQFVENLENEIGENENYVNWSLIVKEIKDICYGDNRRMWEILENNNGELPK